MKYPAQYRHAIVLFLVAALSFAWFAELAAQQCVYGGRAIGIEAAGFDALAFQLFGNPSAAGPDRDATMAIQGSAR